MKAVYEDVHPIGKMESLYDYIPYDEMWTLRNGFHHALQELERTLGIFAHSPNSLVYYRDHYTDLVDFARKRLTSPTFNEGELAKFLEIRPIS